MEDSVAVGVAVRNVFDLLGSEGEEDAEALVSQALQARRAEAAKAKKEAREAAATAAKVEASKVQAAKVTAAPARGGTGGGRGRGGGGGPFRGPRRDGVRGEGGERGGQNHRHHRPPPPPAGDSDEAEHGQSAKGGNFGGGFGGSVQARPQRGRQFDRRSGSDRAPGEKRGGAGKGNWGTAEDELRGETEPLPPTSDEEKEAKDGKEAGAEKGKDSEIKTTEEASAPRQLTLDEWRASRGPVAKPSFNTRKAGEGEAKEKKGLFKPLERAPEDPLLKLAEEEEYLIVQKPSKKRELALDFKFAGGPTIRGGRGGVAGGRGGKAGGAAASNHRGGKAAFVKRVEESETFRVDEASFPSLS